MAGTMKFAAFGQDINQVSNFFSMSRKGDWKGPATLHLSIANSNITNFRRTNEGNSAVTILHHLKALACAPATLQKTNPNPTGHLLSKHESHRGRTLAAHLISQLIFL